MLNLHPSTVSRHLKYWVESGYLSRASPLGTVASFEPGPNLPKQVLHEVLHYATPLATDKTATTVGCGLDVSQLDLIPTIGGEPQPGFIPMRVHSLGHRFKVQEDGVGGFYGPTKSIPWTETTDCSGVPTHVLIIPVNGHDMTDERRIKVVYREGSSSQSIEVWTPEVMITNPTALQEFDNWAAARAQRVGNWLSKKFGFKLGVVEMCRDPHFAAAVPKEVARAAKEIGLRTPDLWCDNSRGRGELETDVKSRAVSIMDIPARFDRLERVIYEGVGPTLEKMVESQERLYTEFSTLNEYLRKILGVAEKAPEPPITNETDPGDMFR